MTTISLVLHNRHSTKLPTYEGYEILLITQIERETIAYTPWPVATKVYFTCEHDLAFAETARYHALITPKMPSRKLFTASLQLSSVMNGMGMPMGMPMGMGGPGMGAPGGMQMGGMPAGAHLRGGPGMKQAETEKKAEYATLGEVVEGARAEIGGQLHWVAHNVGPAMLVVFGAFNAGLSLTDLWDTYARIPFS